MYLEDWGRGEEAGSEDAVSERGGESSARTRAQMNQNAPSEASHMGGKLRSSLVQKASRQT